MLTIYIHKAMSKAAYEKLEDGTYSGEIPDCPGTRKKQICCICSVIR